MTTVLNPFWTSSYGIPDFAAYQSATDGLWNAVFPTPLLAGARDAAERTSATFPFSALGVAAAGYLTLHPYQSTDQSTAANAGVNSAIISAQGAAQESSMAGLIIANCFQVTISMSSGGHVVENVIGVQNGGGTSAGAAAAVLAAWKVTSGPLQNLTNLSTMTGVRAVDISSSSGAIVTVGDTTAGGFTSSNAYSTRAACALVQWNGGTRSRSSRGRLYYGPIMEQDINPDGATLVTARQTAITTAFTNFRNSLNSAGYPLVVLSRTLSQAFPVTAHILETTIATQRRRLR